MAKVQRKVHFLPGDQRGPFSYSTDAEELPPLVGTFTLGEAILKLPLDGPSTSGMARGPPHHGPFHARSVSDDATATLVADRAVADALDGTQGRRRGRA